MHIKLALTIMCVATSSLLGENLVRNADFAEATNPGFPNWWLVRLQEGDIERQTFEKVSECAVPGAKSVKIHIPAASSARFSSAGSSMSSGGQYTMSAYMKSDPPGMEVGMACWAGTQCKLSGEWQRFTRQIGGHPREPLQFILKGPGMVWINAPQVEAGTEATAFGVAPTDRRQPGGTAPVSLAELPLLNCPQLPAPKLDGVVEEKEWERAAHVKSFVAYGATKPPFQPTQVFVLRDAEALYIGAQCGEGCMNRQRIRSGRSVFAGDCFEVFLSPYADGRRYVHFGVGPNGATWAEQRSERSSKAWPRAHWDAAAHRGAKAWTVEMRVPFHALGLTTEADDVWRINFCRNRVSDQPEWTCWSPVKEGFHDRRRFGLLCGLERSKMSRFFLKGRWRDMQRESQGAGFAAAFEINRPLGDLPLASNRLIVEVGRQRFSVAARANQTTSVRFRHLQLSTQRHVTEFPEVSVVDEATQALLLKTVRGAAHARHEERALSILLDRSVYTTEKCARLRVNASRLSLPVNARIAIPGKITQSLRLTEPHQVVAIPLGKIRPGDHDVELSLKDGDGALHSATTRLSLAPKRQRCVVIDRFRRLLLVDGKPFLPFLALFSRPRRMAMEPYLESLRKLGSYGYNGPIRSFQAGEASLADTRRILDVAHNSGLKVVYWHGVGNCTGADQWISALAERIDALRDHPAVLAWYMIDEPSASRSRRMWPQEKLEKLYQATKQHDPYRPAFINYGGDWRPENARSSDFCSLDRYPFGRLDSTEGVQLIAEQTQQMSEDAKRNGQVVAFWLQGSWGFGKVREPTPAEQVCQTYLAVIHGCRAVFYWCTPVYPGLRDAIRQLSKEMQMLLPALSGEDKTAMALADTSAVHLAMFDAHGRRYLIAANTTNGPVECTFYLADRPRHAGNVEVMFENRTLECRQGAWHDRFPPLARHVYVMSCRP